MTERVPTPRIMKCWGTTTALLRTPMFELHRLRIRPWMRCSMHVHRFKHNAFYVIEGVLFVDSKCDGHMQVHDIRPEECYTIAPGVDHQFRTGEHRCVALEMYFTEPLSEDIFRYNEGGPAA